jgi:hypothetical protein
VVLLGAVYKGDVLVDLYYIHMPTSQKEVSPDNQQKPATFEFPFSPRITEFHQSTLEAVYFEIYHS